jgi:peptidoglycan/LPS O-acetylase OafA/YrhL
MIIYRISGSIRGERLARFVKIRYKPVLIYAAMGICFAFPFHLKGFYYLFQLVAVAPLLLVAGCLTVSQSNDEANTATFLGWLSYPLYCLHIPVFRGVYLLHSKYGVFDNVQLVIIATIATLALSVAITKLYDEPLRRLLSARHSKSYRKRKEAFANAG